MPFKKYNNKSRFKTKTRNLRKKNRTFRKSAKKQLGGGSLENAVNKITEALNILTELQGIQKRQQLTQQQFTPQQQQQQQQPPRSISHIDGNFYKLLKKWDDLELQKNEPKEKYWTLGEYRGYKIANIKYHRDYTNDCNSYFSFPPELVRRLSDKTTDFSYNSAESYLRPLQGKIKRPSCYQVDTKESILASNFFENLILLSDYYETKN
jgi:hypothetical protein